MVNCSNSRRSAARGKRRSAPVASASKFAAYQPQNQQEHDDSNEGIDDQGNANEAHWFYSAGTAALTLNWGTLGSTQRGERSLIPLHFRFPQ